MNQVPWCAKTFAIRNKQSQENLHCVVKNIFYIKSTQVSRKAPATILLPLMLFLLLFLLPAHAVATNVFNAPDSQRQNYPVVNPGITATSVSFQNSLPVNFIVNKHYMSSMPVSAITGSRNREEC